MIITPRKRLKSIAIVLLLLCVFTQWVSAQPAFNILNGNKRAVIPFKFIRNLIIVPVKINNKGPYNFVLDTGVGLMIITDPKLVDSLNVQYKRLIQVTGMGVGKDFEAYVIPSLKVEIPGIYGESLSAAILKHDEFGLSNYAGIPIHGLLGYEFFNSFSVKVNFSDSTVSVAQQKDMRISRNSDKLSLLIEDNKPYINSSIKIDGSRAKKNNKLIVDLGAGHPVSLENLVSEKNGMPDKFIASNLGISLTGPIKGFLSRVSEIELGKYKLKNVITSFPDYDTTKNSLLSIKRDGNIGIQILKKFNLIFDYQNGWLYLKPNQFFSEPFEHDMSGIEFYKDGPGYSHVLISNVEKGSAAWEIGLEKGDEITSINFKPVEKMSVEDIDNIFRSRNDRSILLDIFHDNQYDRVILVLKRRI